MTGMSKSLMRRLATESLAGMAVTAARDPTFRGPEAAKSTVKAVTKAYGEYYLSMYDLQRIVSEMTPDMLKGHAFYGEAILADQLNATISIFEAGALMWQFRARAIKSISVHVLPHGSTATKACHLCYTGVFGSYEVRMSPYRCYAALVKSLKANPYMSNSGALPDKPDDHVANTFSAIREPLMDDFDFLMDMSELDVEPRMLRYIREPSRMGADMEKAVAEVFNDMILSVVAVEKPYVTVQHTRAAEKIQRLFRLTRKDSTVVPLAVGAFQLDVKDWSPASSYLQVPNFASHRKSTLGKSGWMWIKQYDCSDEIIEEAEELMDAETFSDFMSMRFASLESFSKGLDRVLGAPAMRAAQKEGYSAILDALGRAS